MINHLFDKQLSKLGLEVKLFVLRLLLQHFGTSLIESHFYGPPRFDFQRYYLNVTCGQLRLKIEATDVVFMKGWGQNKPAYKVTRQWHSKPAVAMFTQQLVPSRIQVVVISTRGRTSQVGR